MKLQSVLFALLCTFSVFTYALELDLNGAFTSRIANVNLTEAYETNSIEVSLRMDGSVGEIYAKKCDHCRSEKYTTNIDTRFYFGSRLIQPKDLVSFNGKSGTVVYYPKTNVLASILYFDLED